MLKKRCVWLATPFAVLGILLIACTATRADLVAYWNMNETSGTIVHDTSGNGINASLINNAPAAGSASWAADGKIDGGVSISGANNYIDCGTNSKLSLGTGDFTFSLWCRGAETSQWRWMLNYNNYGHRNDPPTTPSDPEALSIATMGNYPRFSLGYWFTDTVAGSTPFSDTGWYHVALVRQGTTVTTYINGNQEGSSYTSSADLQIHSLRLGSGPGYDAYNGTLDDVAIWNQALTGTQIQGIFAGTLSPASFAVPEPSCIALLSTGLLGLLAYAWRKRK